MCEGISSDALSPYVVLSLSVACSFADLKAKCTAPALVNISATSTLVVLGEVPARFLCLTALLSSAPKMRKSPFPELLLKTRAASALPPQPRLRIAFLSESIGGCTTVNGDDVATFDFVDLGWSQWSSAYTIRFSMPKREAGFTLMRAARSCYPASHRCSNTKAGPFILLYLYAVSFPLKFFIPNRS